jgi:hypothetical protein
MISGVMLGASMSPVIMAAMTMATPAIVWRCWG